MYEELIKALRGCVLSKPCDACPYYDPNGPTKECATINIAAADAIEELQGRAKVLEKVADKWCEAVPKWIPVTERLPTVDEEVLVVAYGSMMRIWNIHRLDPETADVCWECEDGTLDDVCVVTHWMPLPSPPVEE